MTVIEALKITKTSVRCTHATLRAFGIDKVPTTGSGCLNYLVAAGYSVKAISCNGVLLKQFKYDPNKSYLLNTKHHAMALIYGTLVDTQNLGMDGRKLEFAWEVWKCFGA